MIISKTDRGFDIIEFDDIYGECCSIQKSSLAETDAIWLGISEVKPIIMASELDLDCGGWVKYPIPKSVQVKGRMHLDRAKARKLAKILLDFADKGEIVGD